MRFSERMGISPVRQALQVGSMDEALRNSLWNFVTLVLIEPMGREHYGQAQECLAARRIWTAHLKRPLDTMSYQVEGYRKALREWFYKCPWHGVYDLIEFLVNEKQVWSLAGASRETLANSVNRFLESEMSGYRFIDGVLGPITAEDEIRAVEAATANCDAYAPASAHLIRALELLSDRTSPDFRNSIKESISAVEAACKIITGDPKATLGQAVKKLVDSGVELHPAFRDALSKMYGYTSDADGIRHALLDESTLDADDARSMLVMCSAFVNYLKARAA